MTVLEELKQIQREIDALNRRSARLLDQLTDQTLDQKPARRSDKVSDKTSGKISGQSSNHLSDKPSDPPSVKPVHPVLVPGIEESIFDFPWEEPYLEKTSLNDGAEVPGDGVEISMDSPISIYTDGACSGNPGPAGSGVVVIQNDIVVHEISQSLGVGTNNIAELTAIKLALEFLKDYHRTQVTVYTDSTYSIGILTKTWKAKANVKLVGSIRELMKPFKRLKLTHVKGHSGHPGNERADLLAVRGSAGS